MPRCACKPGDDIKGYSIAATIRETLPGILNQLDVTIVERLDQKALQATGQRPESRLLALFQARAYAARAFPTVEQLEQDEGLVRCERHGHVSHSARLSSRDRTSAIAAVRARFCR